MVTNVQNAPPRLPELPRLPNLPEMDESSGFNNEALPQLPSFPNNSIGDKFSQNTIKEAVTGKKEVELNREDADESEDYLEDESEMMQPTYLKKMTRDYEEEEYEKPISKIHALEAPKNFQSRKMTKKAEPVFIRLDKFEESMELFQNAREQISEIEHLLRETKILKQKEDEQLTAWENEIQSIKNQIEKIDSDIFSKVE